MAAGALAAASGAAEANAQELAGFRAAVREVVEALRGQLTSVRAGARRRHARLGRAEIDS